MKPSIIHAADFSSLTGGNFIASLRVLKIRCEEQGWNFVLALPVAAEKVTWCAKLLAEGWQIHFLPERASIMRYVCSLTALARSCNAVLIHTHFSLYDVAAWAASRLLRLRHQTVRVVWHAHSDFPVRMTPLRRMKDLLKYRVMGRTVRIVAVSEHLRLQILAAGFGAGSIQTAPNGVDLARAKSATRSRVQVCAELHIPADKHLLLLFGWEPTIKGVDIAMDAVERLAGLGLPVILGIVGTSALRDFVACRTRGVLPAWLHIIPPTDHVADLYRAAAVFLSSSRSEGCPYSIAEAMANGLPVVLSDLPGVAWARSPGALFFASGDSAALAAAVRQVLDWNADVRGRHAVANEQLIRTHFDVLVWANRIMGLYSELLGLSSAYEKEI